VQRLPLPPQPLGALAVPALEPFPVGGLAFGSFSFDPPPPLELLTFPLDAQPLEPLGHRLPPPQGGDRLVRR
jgi:hypothetical protein